MRRWIVALLIALAVTGLSFWGYQADRQRRANEQWERIREVTLNSRTFRGDEPSAGLALDWRDCLERIQSGAIAPAQRAACRSWTAQGVTSSLIALRFDHELVPVIESHMAGSAHEGRMVIEIVGGPGDTPFHSNPAITEEMVETFRDIDPDEGVGLVGGIMENQPHYQLLQRGFTIASVGYWGTGIRTLNEPDEIELAMRDVQLVVDRYRAELGREPALLTVSLGNHLALGALGKERFESMDVLALVPVIEGLQHHVSLVESQPQPEDEFYEEWTWFNIYARTATGFAFEQRRMLPMRERAPQFIGEADLPLDDVVLSSACSRIVLGSKDPRTAAYVAATPNPPPFVSVWKSDHNLYRDAPERSRAQFAWFAECLLAG